MGHPNLSTMPSWSLVNGRWMEGNPSIVGPMTQSFQFATMVFDGARAFNGMAPDLERHCQRCINSAHVLGLAPKETLDQIVEAAVDGIKKFPADAATYIRPVFYAEDGMLEPVPESTRFLMTVFQIPLTENPGFKTGPSKVRRPLPDTAPTDAKASCLYPMTGRALSEAHKQGYDNPILLDPWDNVAEFATANIFHVKDGVVYTPEANGTFLSGITRARVIGLLRDEGHEVVERRVGYDEIKEADEIFSTGNLYKVAPVGQIEDRRLQPGPVARKAHDLYFEYAQGCRY